jgi:hypothetical protein
MHLCLAPGLLKGPTCTRHRRCMAAQLSCVPSPFSLQGMSTGFHVIEIHPGGTVVEPSLMVRGSRVSTPGYERATIWPQHSQL